MTLPSLIRLLCRLDSRAPAVEAALVLVVVTIIVVIALVVVLFVMLMLRSKIELIVHPYFDKFDDDQWLYARIIQGTQVSVEYFAAPPGHWSPTKKSRISHHFKTLDLATVFITNGSEELSGIKGALEDLFTAGSAAAVRSHLDREWRSRKASHLNSWQTALYQACATDPWYCGGGFRAFQP